VPVDVAIAAPVETALDGLRPVLGRILAGYLARGSRGGSSRATYTTENREREQGQTTLADLGGNLTRTATILGVTCQNLEHRMRRLGAERPPRGAPALARSGQAKPMAKVGER